MESFKTVIPETYARIWDIVRSIPKGKVSTYGTVARIAGFGRHARLVGYALHALPAGTDVPWHRVINSRGCISLRKESGAYSKQRTLLEREGVILVRDRIMLEQFGWDENSVERSPSRQTGNSAFRERAGT